MSIPKRFALTPVEYAAKAAGGVGAVGAFIGNSGGFSGKLLDGLYNVPNSVLTGIPKTYVLARDFTTDTAAGFTGKYIQQAAETLTSLGNAYENMRDSPVETVAAALSLAAAGWLAGEAVKLYRLEGKGGWISEGRRKIGQRIFGWKD